MLPWYRTPRVRLSAASVLVGGVLGGMVTLALGDSPAPPAAIPERSAADAIASDQAAQPTPTATGTPKAAPKPAARPQKKRAARQSRSAVGATAAQPTATATLDDEELGDGTAPAAAPRRTPAARRIVAKREGSVTPQGKRIPTPTPAPTPQPVLAAPAPAPTSAPQPTGTPQPTSTPTPPGPHRPPPGGGGGGGGGGDDDDPDGD